MRPLSHVPEAILIALILLAGALNGALYGGVLTAASGAAPVLSASQRAELDDTSGLPGRYVPSQGRQHTQVYGLGDRVEFCDEGDVSAECYASNPPSSGRHLPVQRAVRLPDGHLLKLPPDPGVYEFAIPRESIPHIEEHAGVFIGYNCASEQCNAAIPGLRDLVGQEISLGARVVMAPDPDLDEDTFGMASWTRVDTFDAADYDDARIRDFIKAHSCRFDPERVCPPTAIN